MTASPTNSAQHQCCGQNDGDMLSVQEGVNRILAAVSPLSGMQVLDVRRARSRVLATDVVSPINVPAYDNSAMDGYAVASSDLTDDHEQRFTVVGNVLAGHPFRDLLQPGQCVQIMTGAQMPQGLDTVIMKEICRREGDQLFFPGGAKPGQNRRRAGEDLTRGAPAISAGQRLEAAELGMIASLGQSEVQVKRRPRVAYFSTGDEIRSLGQTLEPGQIYDSNRYTITALLASMGIEVIDLGVIPDRAAAIEAAFSGAAAQADVVLSSGGVSLGDADYVKDTLDRLGHVSFWKMAIKPGRPLAFGRLNDALFFGLPGNPVAVMITFLQFVKPALRKLEGESQWSTPVMELPAGEPMRKKPGRTEYIRGSVISDGRGQLQVVSTGQQGSGILTSMSRANCLIELEPERGSVATGDPVRLYPFFGLL
ncbi:molybdopterin molybdotransferase MoeA [Motiliproteus sediminis]|uniref:molybdopterin molybdotransferase MoeA n=1 Tax=Motiliproteus sediminis TaxID=1468178 RepID=UPI001AEFB9EF|nr:bifunctional molybdopterin-guanine dinucleotide biosynthesis adaptor protein MobB/molybdopterin molybdotransferase MoeA [Motiliproteus sediminis]